MSRQSVRRPSGAEPLRRDHGAMNVAGYADDHALREKLQRVAGLNATITSNWQAFLGAVDHDRDAAIAIIPWLDERAASDLSALRAAHPSLGLVLVTQPTADNLLWLRHFIVDEVLWPTDDATEWYQAIRQSVRRSVLHRAQQYIRGCGIPSDMTALLVRSCSPTVAVRDVVDLVDALGYTRQTLYRRWKACLWYHQHPRRVC